MDLEHKYVLVSIQIHMIYDCTREEAEGMWQLGLSAEVLRPVLLTVKLRNPEADADIV